MLQCWCPGLIETSLEAKEEMSNQPVEVGVDTEPEAKSGSYPIEEGEVGPIEEAPPHLQVLVELSMRARLTLEIVEMQLGGNSA